MIFLIAAVAETNRAPFDLPEAETELVSGFHTEYSAFRFSFYFLGEYIAMIVISLFASTLFLGGTERTGSEDHWWLGVFYLFIKTIIFLFFYVWLRATLPRFRYDQLMGIAWKVLLPLVMLNIVVTAAIRLASDGIALLMPWEIDMIFTSSCGRDLCHLICRRCGMVAMTEPGALRDLPGDLLHSGRRRSSSCSAPSIWR